MNSHQRRVFSRSVTMEKNKSTPNTRSTQKAKKTQPQQAKLQPKETNPARGFALLKTIVRRGWALVVAVGVVLGYASYLNSQLLVDPLAPLDPTKPFSTLFTVANKGHLAVHSVEYSCFLQSAHDTGGGLRKDLLIVPPDNRIEIIRSEKKATISCTFVDQSVAGFPVIDADIIINLSFRPGFSPIRKKEAFRFVTAQAVDGKLPMIPQPVPESFLSDPISRRTSSPLNPAKPGH
jgi:hypothetical protein